MKSNKGGIKSWRTPTLFRRALDAKNEDAYWNYVRELHARGNSETFETSKDLCKHSKIRCRRLGADVLAQLGFNSEFPFRKQSISILHNMLKEENSPTVLYSILTALGHYQEKENSSGIKRIADFRHHKSKDVRSGVVFALLSRVDRISVSTLIHLSRDPAVEVRDWATFGLGSNIELDTPAIRKALVARLDDSDGDTQAEAMVGLARRKDPRIRNLLIKELEREDAGTLIFEAAEELGDKTLLPYINRHLESAGQVTGGSWLLYVRAARDALAKPNKKK